MKAASWILDSAGFVPGDAVSLTSRAFRYGMSIFETIAILEGRPLFVREHLDRLCIAAGILGFPVPPHLREAFLQFGRDGCPQPSDSSQNPRSVEDNAPYLSGTGVLRLYLSADAGSPSDPIACATASLQFEPAPIPTEPLPPVALARWPRPFEPPFPGIKSANYWLHIAARRAAMESGADDALLFDACGHLVGATMANVFLHLDGEWHTPSLDSGARDGVVRDWLLRHHPVRQSALTTADTARASAAFLTNSRIGIQAVSALDARTLPPDGPVPPLWRSYHDVVLKASAH
jgi:4-amino-4-deoxychorismate lyase